MPDTSPDAASATAAPDATIVEERIEEVQPAPAQLCNKQISHLGAIQHYNHHPGNAGQQMPWSHCHVPGNAWGLHGNIAASLFPAGWNSQEEAVTAFNVGSHQGFHGVAVSMKPETFLGLTPEQQQTMINLGSNTILHRAPALPQPSNVSSAAASGVPAQEQLAADETRPNCVECDKRITINILPPQCIPVPLCATCYHGVIIQYSMLSAAGHTG